MNGNCRLCGENKELRESHIVPSFVFRWLKETSGSGFLRFGATPNRRVQDGYKYYWLCDDCEGLFSVWERKFAGRIFHPINAGADIRVVYDDYLLKFCVSVSWRVLRLMLEEWRISHFPENLRDAAHETSEVWREFLLGIRPHPDRYEQHLLPLDAIESYTGMDMPTNINRYILRTVDIDAVSNHKEAFIYSKLGRFIIVGFIEMPDVRQWVGTKVHVKHGVVEPKNYTLPVQFSEYFIDKARRAADVRSSISEKQNEKITEAIKADPDKAANSESFRAMLEDMRLFGRDVFKKDD